MFGKVLAFAATMVMASLCSGIKDLGTGETEYEEPVINLYHAVKDTVSASGGKVVVDFETSHEWTSAVRLPGVVTDNSWYVLSNMAGDRGKGQTVLTLKENTTDEFRHIAVVVYAWNETKRTEAVVEVAQRPKSPEVPSGPNNPGTPDSPSGPDNPVNPETDNTDKAIVLKVYDATARSAYFVGEFGDVLPEGYTKTPPRGFMYSTEYSKAEDIYKYGTWVAPLKYKTPGDAENVFRAYVSDLTPGATIYVMACVDYVNEVTYRYSPVTTVKAEVNTNYNGYEYVDLGLSVKWAKCNVGASSETDKGQYFSWGETKNKDNYSDSYYKFYSGKNSSNGWKLYSKYVSYANNGTVDNVVALQTEDDAAHAVMGGTWRTPHDSDFEELIKKCSWSHVEGGVMITGPNGNHIFMPLTGVLSGTETYWSDCGYYLGAELTQNDNSNFCCLKFTGSTKSESLVNNGRSGGYVIRAVTE